MTKKTSMPMNQWETMMAQAADKMVEYQDTLARIRRALNEGVSNTAKLAEISQIMKPYN
jgi:hypothetical protein